MATTHPSTLPLESSPSPGAPAVPHHLDAYSGRPGHSPSKKGPSAMGTRVVPRAAQCWPILIIVLPKSVLIWPVKAWRTRFGCRERALSTENIASTGMPNAGLL